MPCKETLTSWSAIILPPLVPAIFWLVYTPINAHLTVDVFGCGCVEGFNANIFNFILAALVLAGSGIWLVNSSRGLWPWWRLVYLVGGIALLGVSTCYGMLRNLWA